MRIQACARFASKANIRLFSFLSLCGFHLHALFMRSCFLYSKPRANYSGLPDVLKIRIFCRNFQKSFYAVVCFLYSMQSGLYNFCPGVQFSFTPAARGEGAGSRKNKKPPLRGEGFCRSCLFAANRRARGDKLRPWQKRGAWSCCCGACRARCAAHAGPDRHCLRAAQARSRRRPGDPWARQPRT